MTFDSKLWLDTHGDQGMDPEPVDDLRTRHAAMARRIITVAEPMLGRPELAVVQERLEGWREWLKKWRAWGEEKSDTLPGMHGLNVQAYAMMRRYVREVRMRRRTIAVRLAREAVSL